MGRRGVGLYVPGGRFVSSGRLGSGGEVFIVALRVTRHSIHSRVVLLPCHKNHSKIPNELKDTRRSRKVRNKVYKKCPDNFLLLSEAGVFTV
jgi:hypothetical protein